ncbi:hypothetical protein M378DRAFT_174463, partial [Amanita muscaria Koide BX008]
MLSGAEQKQADTICTYIQCSKSGNKSNTQSTELGPIGSQSHGRSIVNLSFCQFKHIRPSGKQRENCTLGSWEQYFDW